MGRRSDRGLTVSRNPAGAPRASRPPGHTTIRKNLPLVLATALIVAILAGLGIWQLERRQWKLGLLAQIDHAENSPAIPLGPDPSDFSKVTVSGTLRPVAALYGSEVRDIPGGTAIGAYLIEALDRPGLPTILINRGWVPTEGQIPAVSATTATIEGYVRPPDIAGRFSAADDPASRRFFTLDAAAIGPALGVSHPAPFTLVQLGTPQPGVYPAPATTLPRPPNDHLSYAITWFSLAVVALVISLLKIRRNLRA